MLGLKPLFRFLFGSIVGFVFLLLPVELNGRSSVLFEHAASLIQRNFSGLVEIWASLLILVGFGLSIYSFFESSRSFRFIQFFENRGFLFWTRILGFITFLLIVSGNHSWIGASDQHASLIWRTLIFSISVVVPIGSILINLFVSYGTLEFVGTLMRPVMRPLFRLPGRSALDDLTSWLGPYSLGLYLTRKLFLGGYYTRREAFMIATCFSTVSISFLGVVCRTLDLLPYFSLIMLCYFSSVYGLAIILIRIWPLARVPDTYYEKSKPQPEDLISLGEVPGRAVRDALSTAKKGEALVQVLWAGLSDGIILTVTILGSILFVGLFALILSTHGSFFEILGLPFYPLFQLFGFSEAKQLSVAFGSGVLEVFLPALLIKDASFEARFFIAFGSLSQILFFSSVIGMMLEMFRDIPMKLWQLVALFYIRSILLIPIGAFLIWILRALGYLS